MSLDPQLLAKARRLLAADVYGHKKRRERWKNALYEREPRLEAIDAQMRENFLTALEKLSPEAFEEAAAASLDLQSRRAELLREMGAAPDSLEDKPFCPECKDSGMLGSTPCSCLMEKYNALQADGLSSIIDLCGQTFESFNPELFSAAVDPSRRGSPRQNIEMLREICSNFSLKFGKKDENLIFSGPPGTGKTFLSACVAGSVSARGFSVVYDTAAHHLSLMESLRFGRGADDLEGDVRRLFECDLLIMDDLGAEFITPFSQSALLDIVNTRLISGKTMLVSTNFTRKELSERYGKALASRLEGAFTWLEFFGFDLRKKR